MPLSGPAKTGAGSVRPDCRPLRAEFDASIAEIVKLNTSRITELKAPPTTLLQAWERASGAGGETTSSGKIEIERGRVANLNTKLANAGCPMVDLNQALSAAKPAK